MRFSYYTASLQGSIAEVFFLFVQSAGTIPSFSSTAFSYIHLVNSISRYSSLTVSVFRVFTNAKLKS